MKLICLDLLGDVKHTWIMESYLVQQAIFLKGVIIQYIVLGDHVWGSMFSLSCFNLKFMMVSWYSFISGIHTLNCPFFTEVKCV
jgi:hypothetical protein